MKKYLLYILLLTCSLSTSAQIVSGPMLGEVNMRTAKIWVETENQTSLSLKLSNPSKGISIKKDESEHYGFHYTLFEVYGLKPGQEYPYILTASSPSGKDVVNGSFKTRTLWEYHMPAPDAVFITGSCAYINEDGFDRPGKPYGSGPEIFETMAKEKADAFVWLGDNWYYRDPDFDSEYGLYYRPHHDRAIPEMQNLLKAMPHYAQWDDHDYGPNNSNSAYIFKDKAREVFQTYWPNPTYGQYDQGIYTKFSVSDVDFFILDTRWFRDADEIHDPAKPFLGDVQMSWLKNQLIASHATFKIICTGSQVLNDSSRFEKFQNYEKEYFEFFNFLKIEKISGVLLLSGDRHHSSVLVNKELNSYPMYELTVSPFTSGTYPFNGPELNPPNRILGIAEKHNYGRISVTGERKKRQLKIDFVDKDGKLIDSWSVMQDELKSK